MRSRRLTKHAFYGLLCREEDLGFIVPESMEVPTAAGLLKMTVEKVLDVFQ